ncbi:MAG: flagellar hook-basal body complex protein FliE [Vitreimonas sp.]
MTDISAINAISAHPPANLAVSPTAQAPSEVNFGAMLTNGIHRVETQVNHADALVRAFAIDDSVPVHQVTIAMEQARLSVELALQVRTKLVDAFHEIMTMQL